MEIECLLDVKIRQKYPGAGNVLLMPGKASDTADAFINQSFVVTADRLYLENFIIGNNYFHNTSNRIAVYTPSIDIVQRDEFFRPVARKVNVTSLLVARYCWLVRC